MDYIRKDRNIIECSQHPSKALSLYCWTCDKAICEVCSSDNHSFHEWGSISRFSVNWKNITKTNKGIQDGHLCQINENIKYIRQLKEENVQKTTEKIRRIDEQKTKMLNVIAKLIENQVQQAEDELVKNNSKLAKLETRFQTHVETLRQKTAQFEKNRNTNSQFLEDHNELKTMMSEMKAMTHEKISRYGELSLFVKGNVEVHKMEKMLGKAQNVSDMNATPISEFSVGEKTIADICPESEDIAWVHGVSEDFNTLVNIKGERKKKQKHCASFGNCTLMENGDMFFNDYMAQCIKRLSPSGLISLVKEAKPLTPLGISQMFDGCLLVTLDSEEFSLTSIKGKSLVWHMTQAGRVLKEYEFDMDGTTKLFACPYRAVQNGNSDICVVDILTSNTGRVVVLRKEGALKFRYEGNDTSKTFDPSMVCCDVSYNILVSDYSNDCVHVITADGQFVRYLLTSQNGLFKPYCLAIFNNCLWIGCRDGKIKVVRHHVTKDMNISYGLDAVAKNSIDFEMIKVINYWKAKNKEEEEEEDENDIDV